MSPIVLLLDFFLYWFRALHVFHWKLKSVLGCSSLDYHSVEMWSANSFFFHRSIQFVYHFTDSSSFQCFKDKTKTCLLFLWISPISSQFIFVFSSENNSFIIVSLVWRRCHWMKSIRCCFSSPFLRTIWFVSVIMMSKCLLWLMELVLDWKRAHSACTYLYYHL